MDLLLEVATAVRRAVLPHLGAPGQRGTQSTSVGGDPTFGIDEIAEHATDEVLQAAGDLAWYTEDRGLVVKGNPSRLLVVDPIDGTRPAGSGLEAACVSIAAAPYGEDAKLGDVDDALILEIKTGTLYRARLGKGVRVIVGGESRSPAPSGRTTSEGAFWVYGLRGRPTMPSAIVLEELIDATGVGSGTFDLGSATFAMMGVVTGRFDAYVDHGQRLIDDVPESRALFEKIASGAVLNNNPYDVAAALLICGEAGVAVSDASGRSLAEAPMVGSGADFCISTVVAATPELSRSIIGYLDRGIDRFRAWMEAA